MQTRVIKWGNSLALRIPQAIAAHFDLEDGSEVSLRIKETSIVVEPLETVPELSALLESMSPDTVLGESEWGSLTHYGAR